MRSRFVALAALIGVLVVAPAAQAGHHLWDFTEIFSNASGSVQFVEMFTADDNEQGIGSFGITSGANTLNFVTNLPTSVTHNTWILCATSNFAALPGGVTPDFIIPANFFNTGGGTLNYASGTDVWNYGAVPTNGVLALQRNGSTANNSPHNFGGQSGQVALTVATPMVSSWGIVLLIGVLLLLGSGLLRRRSPTIA